MLQPRSPGDAHVWRAEKVAAAAVPHAVLTVLCRETDVNTVAVRGNRVGCEHVLNDLFSFILDGALDASDARQVNCAERRLQWGGALPA